MAEKIIRRYGPWRGLNEWPAECGPDQLEDGWNVEFDGDSVRTRGGRDRIVEQFAVYPSRVYLEKNSVATGLVSRTDGTAAVSDGDATTSYTLETWRAFTGTVFDVLYVGFSSPVKSMGVTIGTANDQTAALSAEYYGALGWTAVGALTDGTASSGKTLAQTGTIAWTITTFSDWRTMELNGERLYWIRFKVNAGLKTTTSIIQINSELTVANGLLTGCNGIFQWHLKGGERWLIIGMDLMDPPVARLFVYDQAVRKLRPLSIGAGLANYGPEGRTGPDAYWRFTVIGDTLVACNGYCLLYADPDEPSMLRPFENVALKSGAIQTNSPPDSASFVAAWNGSLYITSRDRPNRVRVSNPVGASRDLKPTDAAPLGGIHLWDEDAWFECPDPSGGGITALVPSGTKLLIMTPRTTWGWQGDAFAAALQQLDSTVGCIAPNSVASHNLRTYFLGPGGVYANDGGVNVLLSRPIEPTIRNLNQPSLHRAVGIAYNRKNQYRLHVPAKSNNENNAVLVYDWALKTWTKFGLPNWYRGNVNDLTWLSEYEVKLAHVVRDSEWSEEILEVDYDGSIWTADVGTTDNGSAIFTLMVFPRIKADDQGVVTLRSTSLQLETFGDKEGSSGVTLVALKDGETWKKVGGQGSLSVTYSPSTQTMLCNTLDADTSYQAQVYMGTNTDSKGARLGTDQWRSKRWVTRKSSMTGTLEGPTGRMVQMLLHSYSSWAGFSVRLRGIEHEVDVREGRR